MLSLAKKSIESRPDWMLNHLQKSFLNNQSYHLENAIKLAKNSLCLPSSSNLSSKETQKIINSLNTTE